MKISKEQRVEELKACAQTIIDRAEEFIGDNHCNFEYEVSITMCPNEMSVITVKRKLFSPEALKVDCNED